MEFPSTFPQTVLGSQVVLSVIFQVVHFLVESLVLRQQFCFHLLVVLEVGPMLSDLGLSEVNFDVFSQMILVNTFLHALEFVFGLYCLLEVWLLTFAPVHLLFHGFV